MKLSRSSFISRQTEPKGQTSQYLKNQKIRGLSRFKECPFVLLLQNHLLFAGWVFDADPVLPLYRQIAREPLTPGGKWSPRCKTNRQLRSWDDRDPLKTLRTTLNGKSWFNDFWVGLVRPFSSFQQCFEKFKAPGLTKTKRSFSFFPGIIWEELRREEPCKEVNGGHAFL